MHHVWQWTSKNYLDYLQFVLLWIDIIDIHLYYSFLLVKRLNNLNLTVVNNREKLSLKMLNIVIKIGLKTYAEALNGPSNIHEGGLKKAHCNIQFWTQGSVEECAGERSFQYISSNAREWWRRLFLFIRPLIQEHRRSLFTLSVWLYRINEEYFTI